MERLILMGIIGKPHGVRGAVRVNALCEDPDALARHELLTRAGRRFRLAWAHENVASLREITATGSRPITDRNEAERLTNTELLIPRDALPPPEDDEFYFADLIGLVAHGDDGTALGTIAAVHDFGAGASLELSTGALIPFTKAAVPHIDLAAGRVSIIPPTELIAAPPAGEPA
jgi:16S rRNA processing protein RimM